MEPGALNACRLTMRCTRLVEPVRRTKLKPRIVQ